MYIFFLLALLCVCYSGRFQCSFYSRFILMIYENVHTFFWLAYWKLTTGKRIFPQLNHFFLLPSFVFFVVKTQHEIEYFYWAGSHGVQSKRAIQYNKQNRSKCATVCLAIEYFSPVYFIIWKGTSLGVFLLLESMCRWIGCTVNMKRQELFFVYFNYCALPSAQKTDDMRKQKLNKQRYYSM